jgi:hypothetical protein
MDALDLSAAQLPMSRPLPDPMRVLILGRDRQFKRMARLLFEQRGSTVRTGADAADAVTLAGRHGIDVVVIDTSDALTPSLRAAAALAALGLPVGVVLVAAEGIGVPSRMATLPKWGPFDELFAEVARVHRRCWESARGADVTL